VHLHYWGTESWSSCALVGFNWRRDLCSSGIIKFCCIFLRKGEVSFRMSSLFVGYMRFVLQSFELVFK
jgi:hypothetical protein